MKEEKTKKIVWAVLLATFAWYCFLLAIRLFVDGRSYTDFAYRFKNINLIPFKTFYDYANRLINDSIEVSIVIYNLLGNLIAFFPMGCYLPCLFVRMREWKQALLVVLLIIVAVEVLQMLLGIGYFDIDDVILNFAGAAAGYGVIRIPVIQRALARIYIYK